MQLCLSFTLLLASLLALSTPADVDARPLARMNKGSVTMPLKRLHSTRGDVHPQVLLQQHINRSQRRLARMSGRAEPSTEELTNALAKRVYSVDSALSKRFNRNGISTVEKEAPGNNLATELPGKSLDAEASGFKIPSIKDLPAALAGLFGGGSAGAGGAGADAGGAGAGGAGAGGAGAGAANPGGAGAGAGGAGGNVGGAGGNAGGAGGSAGGKGAGKGTGTGQAGGAAGGSGAGSASGTGSATGASNSTGTGNAGNSTGVSPIDIQAAQSGGLTAAGQPTANNSLGLDIEANDVGYIATVQMGTPPQDFRILMDSGSADLWVGAENCVSQAGGNCGNNHTFLGPKGSSSFVDTKSPFQVTYGTGAVAGDIITDDLNVAGLQLKAHTFGVANQETVDFSDDSVQFDGLMGLAQSTLSEQKTLTPVESLAKAGLIDSAITSYKISRLADQKNDGEITFGALDTTKFDQQTLTTIPNVNTQGFWEGALDAVTADGQDLGLQGRTAILDTGTTLIVAPDADAAAVHQAIPGAQSDGQGGFTVPCTLNTSVALTFGGNSFAIDPRDIAFAPVDPNDPTGDCTSGISAGNVGGAQEWLVGDVFLKNAYFSTDVDKNTVSLAKLV